MKLLERNLRWMYSVYEDASGQLYMEVLAGGIAMYYVRARLDSGETELLRGRPGESETVALRLMKWPEQFEGRLLSDADWRKLTDNT